MNKTDLTPAEAFTLENKAQIIIVQRKKLVENLSAENKH